MQKPNRPETRWSPSLPGLLTPLLAAGASLVLAFSGCGLGYIDIVPEQVVAFRIENDTPDTAEVTITTSVAGEGAAMQLGDGSANDMVIGVPGGSVTSGWTRCGELVTISTTVGGMTISTVELTGAGTGTPGFDSGSVGLAGERFLIANTHFACEDTILVRLTAPDSGQIVVVPPGGALPDPIASPDEAGTSEPGTSDASKVTFRLENATATAADITVAIEAGGDDLDGSTPVRVPSAEFTTGEVDCGNTFQITATMADGADSTVLLTGDGTGTIGFDSASIGLSGERLLVFGDDYDCGETIVVRITDDGSGIGLSTSETPLGQVNVFSSGDVVPEPDLPDPDDVAIRNIVMQEVAFSGDRVPVRVHLQSKGYEKRTARLSVLLNDRRVSSRIVRFDGGLQFEEVDFRVDVYEKGAAQIDVNIEPFDDEVSIVNNRMSTCPHPSSTFFNMKKHGIHSLFLKLWTNFYPSIQLILYYDIL